MIVNSFARKTLAFSLSVLFAFSSIAAARPSTNPFWQTDEVVKLPPVNWIRSRMIDVKHVSIDLRFDWEKSQAYGSTVVTLAPFKDTDKIALDAAMMQINSVSLASGAALKFNYKGGDTNDNLEITLDRVYKRGEDVSVKVEYRTSYVNSADAETAIGSFGRGLRFIKPTAEEPNKPMQIWSQGETEFNRYWFPSYDSPNDFRTSELKATVDKKYTVVSNGKLISDTENADGTRTAHWKMDTPYTNYLTSIVVGEYADIKQEWNGIPIHNFGYKNETKEVAATVKNLPDMLDFFSKVTGVKYPYPKYAQTFVEDFGGGMENISATTMIEEMIHDERTLLDEDSDSLQAHELAHQWFGDYVTTRDWGQIWLNESFATYFDALYNEKSKGRDDFLYENVRGNQNQYYQTWNDGNRHPIVTKNYANKDAMFDSYAYPRGAAVLHMLRKHLGDEGFFKSLNHYLTTNANQPVSTEDLRIAVEETTGESMDWFFDQWLYKMGHPKFEVTKNYDAATKKLTLNVKQTQTIDPNNEFPQVEYFQAKSEVEIDGRIEQIWIKPQAENTFTFDAAAEPKLVNFDYEGTLIKELNFAKSVDELLYQMERDKDVLGRRWAMDELVKMSEDSPDQAKIMTALLESAKNDSFWRIRRAAISEIREMVVPQAPPGTEIEPVKLDEALATLLVSAAKTAKESMIRAEAIELLGTTKDAKYSELYTTALNDRSYAVIDAAAVALGSVKTPPATTTKKSKKSSKTNAPTAFDALVKLTNTTSWRGRIQIAGLNGLAALGDNRAFDIVYKFASDKTQNFGARTAALSAVGATGKGNPKAFPLIFEAFKASLDANDFNGLFTTVQGIIKLGDPRGQEAFDMLKAKFKGQQNILGFVVFMEAQFKEGLPK